MRSIMDARSAKSFNTGAATDEVSKRLMVFSSFMALETHLRGIIWISLSKLKLQRFLTVH